MLMMYHVLEAICLCHANLHVLIIIIIISAFFVKQCFPVRIF